MRSLKCSYQLGKIILSAQEFHHEKYFLPSTLQFHFKVEQLILAEAILSCSNLGFSTLKQNNLFWSRVSNNFRSKISKTAQHHHISELLWGHPASPDPGRVIFFAKSRIFWTACDKNEYILAVAVMLLMCRALFRTNKGPSLSRRDYSLDQSKGSMQQPFMQRRQKGRADGGTQLFEK